MSNKFLFENVARHAKGLPQQIEWGKAADKLLAANGVITSQDVQEVLAPIWRTEPPLPDISTTGDAGYQLTRATLEKCMGKAVSAIALEDMNRCISKYGINKTKARLCFFLAQCGHESAGLYYTKEIDPGWYIPQNYGLPEISDSDGAYIYRGAGYIQLSLPDNYQAFADYMGDRKIYDLGCPYVAENYPARSAGFWWEMNKMNKHVDCGEDMYEISGRVNCGSPTCKANGMDDRLKYYDRCVDAIAEDAFEKYPQLIN